MDTRRLIVFTISLSLTLLYVKSYFMEQNRQPNPVKQAVVVEEIPVPKKGENEKYYVLENDLQQLVFSSVGGALVEINLPFKTKENEKSVVLPVEADRDIREESPKNALFPLQEAFTYDGSVALQKEGGYYPLLRRPLITEKGASEIAPSLYACTITSQYPELASLQYTLVRHSPKEIVFEAKQVNRRITKRYYFPEDQYSLPYCLLLEVTIAGDKKDLFITSGVPEVEWMSGASGAEIKYRIAQGSKNIVERIDLPKTTFSLSSFSPDWICNSNGFFSIILDPIEGAAPGFRAEQIPGTQIPSRITLIGQEFDRYPAKDYPGYSVLLPLQPVDTMYFRLYAGPLDEVILEKIDAYSEVHPPIEGKAPMATDYNACRTFHGWFSFISEPFAKLLYFLMRTFHSLFGSWALSIVLTTVALRIFLYPLNNWSMRSMKRMQLVNPQIKVIQDKYKNAPQKAQMEILALYRKHKVNPLSGCLPLLIQMPFLIGMFDLLKSAFPLRGASFIPGWIDNLSAPDVLFQWGYPLPIIGNELHLLPIFLGGIMLLQQNYSSQMPKDPNQMTDQQRQQKSMGTIMTLVMTIMFYQFPSGLNIYWISSMLLGIAQQWYINKGKDTEIMPQEITVIPKS